MKSAHLVVLSSLILAAAQAAPSAIAQQSPGWLTRCARDIGGNNDAETARYIFQTMGKAEGAQGRAEMDYTTKGFSTQTIYPTEAKDLMNPYGGASLAVGYYGLVDPKAPYAVTPKVGHVSMGAIARDFKPIPGLVRMKLVIDGKVFGPYDPKASSLDMGQYSVWLDTADTDGDSKPPILKPAEFAVLAKAIDAMKVVEVVLVKEGVDIVRMPVSLKQFTPWRDALPKWGSETRQKVNAVTFCLGSDKSVN